MAGPMGRDSKGSMIGGRMRLSLDRSSVAAGQVTLLAVQDALNSRPRKVLGWKTPAEALDEQLRSLQHAGVATTG